MEGICTHLKARLDTHTDSGRLHLLALYATPELMDSITRGNCNRSSCASFAAGPSAAITAIHQTRDTSYAICSIHPMTLTRRCVFTLNRGRAHEDRNETEKRGQPNAFIIIVCACHCADFTRQCYLPLAHSTAHAAWGAVQDAICTSGPTRMHMRLSS